MPHDPLLAVRYMLDHAREASALAANRSRADLESDRAFNLQLTRLMEIIGESSRRVPQEFRLKYPETDWRGFAGLRDVLIHKFDAIDYEIFWDIVQNELPTFIVQLETILERET